MRFRLLLLSTSFAALGLAACSSSTTTSSATVTPSDDAGVDAGPVRSDACILQDTNLQAALDGARKSPSALLAVKNEACGTTVYTSGTGASAASLFHVASVTKTFVSAALLSLVKEGKVSLDDPLSKWVPGLPNTDGVTIHMLMNHTSGIFNFTEVSGFPGTDSTKKWTPRDLVDLATKNPPYFAPGKGWHYSNTNYVLVGMIAEQASGKSLGALIRERALVPAGLTHTFFNGEEPVAGDVVKGFIGKNDVTNLVNPSAVWASGAMLATPGDLVEWFPALYTTDAVLDESTRSLLMKDPAEAGQGLEYGLGVTILNNLTSHGAGAAWGHQGDLPGFHCAGYYFTDKKTTVVAMVNSEEASSSASSILFSATHLLFQK